MPQILNEVEHSYLSLEADFSLRDHFELRMLEENRISGLLPLTVSDDNRVLNLHYDITGLESLSDLTARKKLKAQDIRCIILTLKHVISGLQRYLLDPAGICLGMDRIFASAESFSPCFLYLPGQSTTFSSALTKFLQELLTWTDHDDDSSVVLAYRLYRESLDHPSALERLEQILVSQDAVPDSDSTAADSAALPPEETVPVDSALSENPKADPLVMEIREVPAVPDDDTALSDTEKGGLFHRLFQ